MQNFAIPTSPEQLLQDGSDGIIRVQQPTAVAELDAGHVQEFADGQHTAANDELFDPGNSLVQTVAVGVVYDLVNENALCITKQRVFDGVFSLIRYVLRLGSSELLVLHS